MYNRTPFNLTKYNTGADNKVEMIGVAEIRMTASAVGNVIYGGRGTARPRLNGSAIPTRVRYNSLIAKPRLNAAGRGIRRRYGVGVPAAIWMNAYGGYVGIYGRDVLQFSDIVIPVGGELKIDTEEMTATINGVNAIGALSLSSIFFKLQPGENQIIFEGGTCADVYVIWKDRWL